MSLKVFAVFLVFLVSGRAPAAEFLGLGGVDGGGGGKGVLCQTSSGRTLESLDLYEAKNVWGYTLHKAADLDTEIRTVMPIYWTAVIEDPEQPPPKYDEKSFEFFRWMYEKDLTSQFRFIPSGARLKPTDDATIILEPPANCQIVQVLVYLDEGSSSGGILVDKEYWDLVDDQNRMAFYLHERDYKGRRAYSDTKNTDAIRKYVGALFATSHFPSRVGAVRNSPSVLKCKTLPAKADDNQTALFYAVPIDNPPWVNLPHSMLYFDQLGKFGSRKGPVEYKAETVTTANYFLGIGGTGMYGGTLFVDSILSGEVLGITGKESCSVGQSSDCAVELFLTKQKSDGTELREQIVCEEITVIPN